MRKRRPSSWCARISRPSPSLLTNSFSLRISSEFYLFLVDIVFLVVIDTSLKFRLNSYENKWRNATEVSIVMIGAYRISHDRCAFSLRYLPSTDGKYENHHGGQFFESTAIFSVLIALEDRNALCIDHLHARIRAALWCFMQYSCWTQEKRCFSDTINFNIAKNILGFQATTYDWRIVLPTSSRWSDTAFHSWNFRDKPWRLKPLRCPLFQPSLLPKD